MILKIDGKSVDDARDLARKIGGMAPNTKAELTVLRDGKEQTSRVTLGTMKEDVKQQLAKTDQQQGDKLGRLGLSVAPAASVDGAGRSGLVVTDVDPAGAAADAGIQAGDVILRIGEREIGSVKDLRHALSEATSHGRTKALALVKSSGGGERYVALPAAAAWRTPVATCRKVRISSTQTYACWSPAGHSSCGGFDGREKARLPSCSAVI